MADLVALYLIRHGVAAELGDAYPDDNKRPLIGRGIAHLREAVAALIAFETTFDQIITSPIVRAKQTAAICRRHNHD